MAPSAELSGRRKPTKSKKLQGAQKRKRDDVDVEKLEQAVEDLDPKASYKNFTDLPLSDFTKAGLKSSHFVELTDIQAKAIPLALKGTDILGAAKTGSGKTLAFIVPILENLYRAQCIGPDAGLGAMVIAPTRELAVQIFEVLYKIGRKGHLFAAGLVIGGKNLREEQDALSRMNIVVCTPGRILQHLSQTSTFNADHCKMLVLDEADRILDMGFQKDVDAIIEYLPRERQTLLFSATQTKKISDLARLSLKDHEYISVHDTAAKSTPTSLQQNYCLTPLSEKLDTLWSFIQSSKKSKILVFLSSAKQVRHVYEAFRKLQPGIPLLHLHGRQKQTARMEITAKFAAAKESCLFSTDVAARGLDFPAVDWVVQVDCPEDADTYIHRVGRTARYNRAGRAILMLDPSEEEGMLKRLEQKKTPIEKINVRQKKRQSITTQLANLCFKDPMIKYLAQKSFASYVKSIYIQKDKEIFHLDKLPLEEYATSLGLPGAPRIKFLKGDNAHALKNAPRHGLSSDEEEDGDGIETDIKAKPKKQDGVRTKYDRMFERVNQDILTDHYTNLIAEDNEAGNSEIEGNGGLNGEQEEDDGFMSVKRRIDVDGDLPSMDSIPADKRSKKLVHIEGAKEPILIDSKRAEKRLGSKKKLLKFKDKGDHVVFDDEGKPHPLYELQNEDDFKGQGLPEEQRQKFLEEERQRVAAADLEDKDVAKAKRREKLQKRKETRKRENAELEAAKRGEAVVAGPDESGEDAFANFIADAQGLNGSERSDIDVESEEEETERPKKKKAKKWFEDDSGDEIGPSGNGTKRRGRGKKAPLEEPETLEDLEALAAGLLS
ncbi:ATP-dependent RNA helicase dbp4 [Venturia effusa]|uniref:ATP-dependent RNA helicase n=1 Tax=Venturia effusa TaxID=50376 RepID=A0A517LF72_9PEZI|nr:ATP-dependent RNA helicase dbp4 [Venturia effusa]